MPVILVVVGVRNDEVGEAVGVVFRPDIAPEGNGVSAAVLLPAGCFIIVDTEACAPALPQAGSNFGQRFPMVLQRITLLDGFRRIVRQIPMEDTVGAVIHMRPALKFLREIITVEEPVKPITLIASNVLKPGGEHVKEIVCAAEAGLLSPAGVVQDI